MVTRINQSHAISLNAIAESRARVIQRSCRDGHVTNLKLTLFQIIKLNSGGQLIQRDREERGRHLSSEGLSHCSLRRPGSIDIPETIRCIKRREEWQALNVIPVQVTDKNMASLLRRRRGDQACTEFTCTATHVKDEQFSRLGTHLNTGCVAPIAKRVRSRRWDRSPGSPEPDPHGRKQQHNVNLGISATKSSPWRGTEDLHWCEQLCVDLSCVHVSCMQQVLQPPQRSPWIRQGDGTPHLLGGIQPRSRSLAVTILVRARRLPERSRDVASGTLDTHTSILPREKGQGKDRGRNRGGSAPCGLTPPRRRRRWEQA